MIVVDLISDDPNNKFAPYGRMATAIVDITRKKGMCAALDLLEAGFTRQEIDDLFHMANAMAAVELKLMDSQSSHLIKKRRA